MGSSTTRQSLTASDTNFVSSQTWTSCVLPHHLGSDQTREKTTSELDGRSLRPVAQSRTASDNGPRPHQIRPSIRTVLNPGRKSMPDIDMDFDDRYRDEMIRYTAETYGREHVAQIITFSTIKARAAVRDAARVLGYPYAVGDKVATMPPLVMGLDTPLLNILIRTISMSTASKPLQNYAKCTTRPDVKRVVDVAKGLEVTAPGLNSRRSGRDHPRSTHRISTNPTKTRIRCDT